MFEDIFVIGVEPLARSSFLCPFLLTEIFWQFIDNGFAAHVYVELTKELKWSLGLCLPGVTKLFVVMAHISCMNFMYQLPVLWLVFTGYKMLMSLFSLTDTKKIHSSF